MGLKGKSQMSCCEVLFVCLHELMSWVLFKKVNAAQEVMWLLAFSNV